MGTSRLCEIRTLPQSRHQTVGQVALVVGEYNMADAHGIRSVQSFNDTGHRPGIVLQDGTILLAVGQRFGLIVQKLGNRPIIVCNFTETVILGKCFRIVRRGKFIADFPNGLLQSRHILCTRSHFEHHIRERARRFLLITGLMAIVISLDFGIGNREQRIRHIVITLADPRTAESLILRIDAFFRFQPIDIYTAFDQAVILIDFALPHSLSDQSPPHILHLGISGCLGDKITHTLHTVLSWYGGR